jgi:uncharacterized protein
VNEKKILKNNVKNTRHTVLLGPRRYGKTSLVTEVINEINYPYCAIDFLLCGNSDAVQAKILDQVGQLLYQILPNTIKIKKKILALFYRLRPEISISYHNIGVGVKLYKPTDQINNETTICDVLKNLDKAAGIAKKQAIVFMDEFQQIGLLKDQHVIEAAIRHAVERAKNITYLFSGSNRHLLLQMFNDKNRPFYRLCHTFPLKRIPAAEHIDFIQKQAKAKWKKQLPDEVIKEIGRLSEFHPYYINLICNYFWSNNEFLSVKKIRSMWLEYIKNQRSIIVSDISNLSNNQKIALKYFANHPSNQPYGNDVLIATKLTSASLRQAINKLVEKDLLFTDDMGFLRVLDPAMRSFIIADS